MGDIDRLHQGAGKEFASVQGGGRIIRTSRKVQDGRGSGAVRGIPVKRSPIAG